MRSDANKSCSQEQQQDAFAGCDSAGKAVFNNSGIMERIKGFVSPEDHPEIRLVCTRWNFFHTDCRGYWRQQLQALCKKYNIELSYRDIQSFKRLDLVFLRWQRILELYGPSTIRAFPVRFPRGLYNSSTISVFPVQFSYMHNSELGGHVLVQNTDIISSNLINKPNLDFIRLFLDGIPSGTILQFKGMTRLYAAGAAILVGNQELQDELNLTQLIEDENLCVVNIAGLVNCALASNSVKLFKQLFPKMLAVHRPKCFHNSQVYDLIKMQVNFARIMGFGEITAFINEVFMRLITFIGEPLYEDIFHVALAMGRHELAKEIITSGKFMLFDQALTWMYYAAHAKRTDLIAYYYKSTQAEDLDLVKVCEAAVRTGDLNTFNCCYELLSISKRRSCFGRGAYVHLFDKFMRGFRPTQGLAERLIALYEEHDSQYVPYKYYANAWWLKTASVGGDDFFDFIFEKHVAYSLKVETAGRLLYRYQYYCMNAAKKDYCINAAAFGTTHILNKIIDYCAAGKEQRLVNYLQPLCKAVKASNINTVTFLLNLDTIGDCQELLNRTSLLLSDRSVTANPFMVKKLTEAREAWQLSISDTAQQAQEESDSSRQPRMCG